MVWLFELYLYNYLIKIYFRMRSCTQNRVWYLSPIAVIPNVRNPLIPLQGFNSSIMDSAVGSLQQSELIKECKILTLKTWDKGMQYIFLLCQRALLLSKKTIQKQKNEPHCHTGWHVPRYTVLLLQMFSRAEKDGWICS